MNEVVKYDGSLNKLNFTGLSKQDEDLFMAILARAKDKHEYEIAFQYDELFKLIGSKRHLTIEEQFNALENMRERIFNINSDVLFVDENGKRESHAFHIFEQWDNYEATKEINISISPRYTWLLNDLRHFVGFRLEEFVTLDSIYSKNLYRILKEFKDYGYYIFHSPVELRAKLGIADNVRNDKIKTILEKSKKELVEKNIFSGLDFEIVKEKKRGAPIKEIRFTWDTPKEEGVVSDMTSNSQKEELYA